MQVFKTCGIYPYDSTAISATAGFGHGDRVLHGSEDGADDIRDDIVLQESIQDSTIHHDENGGHGDLDATSPQNLSSTSSAATDTGTVTGSTSDINTIPHHSKSVSNVNCSSTMDEQSVVSQYLVTPSSSGSVGTGHKSFPHAKLLTSAESLLMLKEKKKEEAGGNRAKREAKERKGREKKIKGRETEINGAEEKIKRSRFEAKS